MIEVRFSRDQMGVTNILSTPSPELVELFFKEYEGQEKSTHQLRLQTIKEDFERVKKEGL